MTTPVVICDDSSFARKQIARALPSDWKVSITYAASGREGIEAIRQGMGDVLFLDLTMPDMDGFDVLEFIRNNNLPALPIVISGDIQEESQRRVKQLGAVAFIKKPVNPAELVEVLQGYGVLELLNAEPAAQLEEVDFYDWCQEIANVAMGRAASLLAGVIHEGVELSIPRVNLLERSELVMLLGGVGHHGVSIVSQGFIGAGLAGETLLFFDDSSVPALARLMNYDDSAPEESELELLMEVGNVLVGAFLKGISEQLDVKFSQGHPRLYLHSQAKELLQGGGAQRTLAIELSYDIGSVPVHCDQVLLFTETSINALQQHMEVVRL